MRKPMNPGFAEFSPKKIAPIPTAEAVAGGTAEVSPPAPATAPVTPEKVSKKRKATAAKAATPKKAKKESERDRAAREKAEELARRKLRYEPFWGQRRDCPLLDKLHGDVLNKIFNPDQGFESRDWISLAGANTFFRDHLNDDVFKELYSLLGKERSYVTKKHRGPAYHAFTQDIVPWREAHPAVADPLPTGPFYYTPEGPRETWTKEQYLRYKKEKEAYISEQRHELEMAEENYQKYRAAYKGDDAYQKRTILYEGYQRKIESIVPGIKATRIKEWVVPDGEWKVPDVKDEDDFREEPTYRYVNREEVVPWSSEWRSKVAEEVNNHWVKQSDVAALYKVNDLKTLKHALVPIPNIYKTKAHAYQVAAVKSLAMRLQGGYEGYLDHIEDIKRKANKSAATRQAKFDKAIAEGKPLPGRKKKAAHASMQRAPYHDYMEQFCSCCAGCNDDYGSDECENENDF